MHWEEIATLEDMERYKAEFLEDPGCDVDREDISSAMDASGLEEDELLEAWFEAVIARFRGKDEIEVYRHMAVPDFTRFVEGLEAGSETAGIHWSLSEGTWSPAPEQGGDADILLAGIVPAASMDWFTTFQNFFSHPWEEEVAFEGDLRLLWVKDLASGETHAPRLQAYPTMR